MAGTFPCFLLTQPKVLLMLFRGEVHASTLGGLGLGAMPAPKARLGAMPAARTRMQAFSYGFATQQTLIVAGPRPDSSGPAPGPGGILSNGRHRAARTHGAVPCRSLRAHSATKRRSSLPSSGVRSVSTVRGLRGAL